MSKATEGAKHTTIITSDQPISVIAGETSGHWFRIFATLVDGGYWSQLSPSAAKVLIVLARHVNDTTRQNRGEWLAWPSITTIMDLAGTGRAITFRAITELERFGLLRRQTNGGGRSSTVYLLVEPTPVYGRRPVHERRPHPSNGVDRTRPRAWTLSRLKEVDRTTTTDDDVLKLLVENGFAGEDAKRICGHQNATLEQVTIAIGNANHVESQGKLKDRRGYIRKAIEQGHVELDGVKRARREAEKRTKIHETETAAAKAERERRARAREHEQRIERVIVGLSDTELKRYTAAVLSELEPAERQRLSLKDPRTNGRLRAAIFERVGVA